MRKQWLTVLGAIAILTGCTQQTESEPLSTIPTEPVVYEDTGKTVIHAGYYGENKKVYINKGTSVKEAEKTNPDYEIETSYDYDGRKTEICVYTYNGEEKTLLKHETYAYDENGKIVTVESYDESETVISKAEKQEDGWHETDKDGNAIEASERDDAGNATTETNEDGSKTRTFRNTNNDILTKETYDKDGNLLETMECTYTANDRLPDNILIKDGTGATTEEYYLLRGNMRNDEMYNRYFKMSDSENSVMNIEDTYDESSGLILSSVMTNVENGETIIELYTYIK